MTLKNPCEICQKRAFRVTGKANATAALAAGTAPDKVWKTCVECAQAVNLINVEYTLDQPKQGRRSGKTTFQNCKDCQEVRYVILELHKPEDRRIEGKRFCLACQEYHCIDHQRHCVRIHGSSVMDYEQVKDSDEFRRMCKQWDTEYCKLSTWSDQIDFKIIVCAECKKTVCKCSISEFEYKFLSEEERKEARRKKEELFEHTLRWAHPTTRARLIRNKEYFIRGMMPPEWENVELT